MLRPFCFVLLFVNLSVIACAQKSIKIVNYNTLHGFEGNAELKKQYILWIKNVNPDIVAYQEMIGFTSLQLTEFAAQYGHKYSVIMNKEAGLDVTHPLAITSKYPIKDVKMVLDSLWHGYLNVKIKELNLFVTHLAPFTFKDRQKDIGRIIADTKALNSSDNVMILGDFNALAKTDSAMYAQKDIESLRKLEGVLQPKSGTPIVKNRIIYINNLDNGKIDYSIIDRLLKAGFIDTFKKIHPSFKNSVPTKADKNDSMLRRIDFIFINKNLENRLISADIIHDKVTDFLSDHYPIMVELKTVE
jgi:exodeoxyribonuclease-3